MIKIQTYEHIGIRVTNLDEALQFYAMLGFKLDPLEIFPQYSTVVVVNETGLRLNLIHGGGKRFNNRNVLLDELERYPGLTHVAFVVKRLKETMDELNIAGINITEGPVKINERRSACFVRDPDGNVIEFNETAKT